MKSQDSRNKNQDFERFILMKIHEPRIKILTIYFNEDS